MITLQQLTTGIRNCPCGMVHECPIDAIVIEQNALRKLPELCRNYQDILLVSDYHTYPICGKNVKQILGEKIQCDLILEDNGDVVIPNEEKIAEITAHLTKSTDLIIGVGSGVINDLCKHVSFTHNLPYYIVATAPSMDGYASVGSALILEGMKVTLSARPPKAIIADLDVIKDAPMPMLQAGYGDIIGKYSCLNDWKLSRLINNEYFCEEIYGSTYATAQNVEKLADDIVKRVPAAVGELMQALVYVGVMMSFVGNSRPASGSEHHLSHFFEITGILNKEPYLPHGIDVAFSSVVTAGIREKILRSQPHKQPFDRSAWEQKIREIYSSSADGIIALQDKVGRYEKDDESVVTEHWDAIKAILEESPKQAEFLAMLNRIGLQYADFEAIYGKEKIRTATRYAKDLKDRYTVLNLYYSYFGE